MAAPDWIESEPGAVATARQLAAFFAAGFRRARLVWTTSCLAALAAVLTAIALTPAHAPRFVIRATEMDRDPESMPQPKRALREYVLFAVFTSSALTQVMTRHDLYPSLRRDNPRAALDSFREDLEVEVYQNYFLEERSVQGAPRSARIALSYASRDRAVAIAVTRELGELIIEHERRVRREQAAADAKRAGEELERANLALSTREREVLDKQLAIQRSGYADPRDEVELVSLLGSLGPRERRVEEARKKKTELELGSAVEQHGMGLHFEVLDDASVPSRVGLGRGGLFVLALVALAFSAPLVAAWVGVSRTERGVP